MKTEKGAEICVAHNNFALSSIKEARYQLTITEQRLLLILISKINREHDAFNCHTISVKEIEKIVGISTGNIYNMAEKACRGLMTKLVTYFDPQTKERVEWNWCIESRYMDSEGIIRVQLNPNMASLFLKLKEHFFCFPLSTAIRLGSVYAVRLYELCKSKEFMKTFTMTVDELRTVLHVPQDSFDRYNDFKRMVLLYAQKQIREEADIFPEIEELKTGRKVTSIKFTIRQNPLKQQELDFVTQIEKAPKGWQEWLIKNYGTCNRSEEIHVWAKEGIFNALPLFMREEAKRALK